MKIFNLLILSLVMSSCALAPFTDTKTGSSLGKGNWEVDTGFSPVLFVSGSYGVSKNFDLTATYESQLASVVALSGKYSFINNNKSGISLAMTGGGFKGFDILQSTGLMGGPILSFKAGWFETYFVARYNWIKWSGDALTPGEEDDLFFDITGLDNDVQITYLQYTWGFNFWFAKSFGLNIHAKYMSFLNDDSINADAIVPGIGIIVRF